MNAIQFIKENGVEKARGVVSGAPEFPVFGYCTLTGSYIFKRKDATAYYHNETNSWSEEYAIELIFLDDLKRLVESVDLIKSYGGIINAKHDVKYLDLDCDYDTPRITRLKQAIADYESIYGVSMFKVGDLGRKRAKTKELPDLNYLKSLIQYCPNTGNIWWLDTEHVSKKLRGQLANSYFKSTGYKRICIDKKIYCQHRIAWLFCHGKEPVGMIDHINGIRDDNRLENLRDVSNSVNGQNKKIAMSSNRIGVLGVRYRKSRISKPYEACIKVNGKNKYLGNYSTPEEAHQAYLTAKRELHEGCTI